MGHLDFWQKITLLSFNWLDLHLKKQKSKKTTLLQIQMIVVKRRVSVEIRYVEAVNKMHLSVPRGTTAHVGVSLYGREGRSGHRHLDSRGAFARNALDIFHVATDTSLGNIWKIRIWHDNKGTQSHTAEDVNRLIFEHTSGNRHFSRSVSSVAAAVRPGQRLTDRQQLILPGRRVAVCRQRADRRTGRG